LRQRRSAMAIANEKPMHIRIPNLFIPMPIIRRRGSMRI
jgi:hypothetical protein